MADIDHVSSMLLILVGSLLLGIVATALFRSTVPGLVARMFHTDEAERSYQSLLKEGFIVRDRLRALQNEQEHVENIRAKLESELRKVQRRATQMATAAPDFVHEVGDARVGHTRYLARLSVDSTSPLLRTTSESYNPMWHCVNLADIWAGSRDEARQTLELAYSDKLGYQKVFLGEAQTSAEERRS